MDRPEGNRPAPPGREWAPSAARWRSGSSRGRAGPALVGPAGGDHVAEVTGPRDQQGATRKQQREGENDECQLQPMAGRRRVRCGSAVHPGAEAGARGAKRRRRQAEEQRSGTREALREGGAHPLGPTPQVGRHDVQAGRVDRWIGASQGGRRDQQYRH
jgi:hypothetical protein